MDKILHMTSVGNAIISEILKLTELIPEEFKESDKNKKFNEVILNFSYFTQIEEREKIIENDTRLAEMDEMIRENYSRILCRFYLAFESIFEYVVNLNEFITQLNDGEFIQQSIETILQDPEGCQLLCESLYLYAVMLIVLDIHIPGITREKLLVSYYRYHAETTQSDCSVDEVCKFCRSTGYIQAINTNTSIVHFQPQSSTQKGYPENFFKRVQLDDNFVELVIETLKSEDIYHQMQKFPSPQQRSMAMSTQSAMLFACLYFQPDILINQTSRMREIIDKFFSNNWVISLYMGLTVNLIDAWDGYKAAKTALAIILNPTIIKEITLNNDKVLKKMLEQTRNLLKEGILNENFLMKNLAKIIKVIRECNFAARWWILNSSNIYTKKSKQIHDVVIDSVVDFKIFDQYELVLNISQLELCVTEIVKDLLENRDKKWSIFKADVDERLQEMVVLFAGEKTVIKIEKNDHLMSWFEEIRKEIESLDIQKGRLVEKKLIQLVQAVSEVQEFHNLNCNMHVKQRLDETLIALNNMIYLLSVKDSVLVDLQIIGDFNYAWYLIDDFTPMMQESLQRTPNVLIKLRALFIKISTALEIPLMRINQCGAGEELMSITRYYSNELVKYIRKIVQIIPNSIFELLKSIIDLQTNNLKELPMLLDKDKLKEFAQLDDRYKIAKLTFTISVFTDGILAMKKTLVGVIELDPKQLLEDGIRKELIRHVSVALNENLQFPVSRTKNSKDLLVVENLIKLSKIIDGYRRSFEYIQDYLNINGLKIWQEEMLRLINFNVEQECNSFMRRKVQFSRYQSDSIPIPIHEALPGSLSVTFIGRLGRELLKITDPKTTLYVDLLTAWFDIKSHQELINLKFTAKIHESIELYGLVGLDKLYSYMISNDLEIIHNLLLKKTLKEKQWLELFQKFKDDILTRKMSNKNTQKMENPMKSYSTYISKCGKLPNMLGYILGIGQKQVWRQHISHELITTSRFNCKNLSDSLKAFNDALIYELKCNEQDNTKPKPSSQLLLELNKYLEVVGNYDPLEKVYIKMGKNSNEFLSFAVIFVLSHLSRFAFGKNLLKYNKASGANSVNVAITKQRKLLLDSIVNSKFIDGHVFLLGFLTLLRQFYENNYLVEFVQLFGSCLLEMMEFNLSSKNELNLEILNGIDFIENFITLTGISRSVLEAIIPGDLLDQSDYILTMSVA
ncbi:unnamed protein product [Diamesa serratosioi]